MDFIKIRLTDDRPVTDDELSGSLSGRLRLFDPEFTLYRRLWRPAVDICESPDQVLVYAELAGVSNEDLHLEIGGRRVRIYGRRAERFRNKQTRYHLAEITYGSFERTLDLPFVIDVDRVEAAFADGILEIRIPKTPPEKGRRKISIQGR